MDWSRMFRHLAATHRGARTLFGEASMKRLQETIAAGESTHRGEVRLIVESALPLRKVRRRMMTRQRALDLFGTFRVWDTEENNGVLLYINMADRSIEIIADRAAARLIDDARWQAICLTARDAFKAGDYERGVAQALEAIHGALGGSFPLEPGAHRRNELADAPSII